MMRPADAEDDSIARTIASTINDGIHRTVAHWRVLLLGQAVAFILAVAGATNEVLAVECGVNAPSTYNLFAFTIVAVSGAALIKIQDRLARKRGKEDAGEAPETDSLQDDLTEDGFSSRRPVFSLRRSAREGRSHDRPDRRPPPKHPFLCGAFTLHARWEYYLVVAFIETQAYYLLFLAFRYTSFTFIYVSAALAIPSAVIFSKVLMKRTYCWPHIIGCAVCFVGIVINTADDLKPSDMQQEMSLEQVTGDVYAIASAILLGLDDVLSEIIISDYGGVNEMLFMKGLFGALISVAQLAAFERDAVHALFGATGSCALPWQLGLLAAHVGARSLDVAGQMTFLYVSEAALLNLLLLTSDLYAVVFDAARHGVRPTPHFYAAFLLILLGIVLFEAAPGPSAPRAGGTPTQIELRRPEVKAGRAGKA